jgi:hypothetical protein
MSLQLYNCTIERMSTRNTASMWLQYTAQSSNIHRALEPVAPVPSHHPNSKAKASSRTCVLMNHDDHTQRWSCSATVERLYTGGIMPADRLFSSKENVKRYRQSENESLGVRADRTKSTHTSSRGLVLHREKQATPPLIT